MEKQKDYKKFIILAFSSIGGIGYIRGGGSLVSLLGVGAFLLIKSPFLFLGFTLLITVLALPLSSEAEKILKKKDPKEVVIDDLAGCLVSLLFIPKKAPFVISAFFLFRLFDLLKIPPADILEREKGWRGIVGDDLVAGLYANILIQGVKVLLKIFS